VEQIKFSKFLATIKTDAPVEFDEARFVIEEPDVKALVGIYEELEFRSHIKKLGIRNEELGVKDNSGMGSLFGNEELGMRNEELRIENGELRIENSCDKREQKEFAHYPSKARITT
jgi:5'-3' exonuclease